MTMRMGRTTKRAAMRGCDRLCRWENFPPSARRSTRRGSASGVASSPRGVASTHTTASSAIMSTRRGSERKRRRVRSRRRTRTARRMRRPLASPSPERPQLRAPPRRPWGSRCTPTCRSSAPLRPVRRAFPPMGVTCLASCLGIRAASGPPHRPLLHPLALPAVSMRQGRAPGSRSRPHRRCRREGCQSQPSRRRRRLPWATHRGLPTPTTPASAAAVSEPSVAQRKHQALVWACPRRPASLMALANPQASMKGT
mmetsp:Transcript_137207/g.293129  ORF Transcript_137207/g.293129 Transcript_137207/m.293129 type:complete len:255 (-) Transcript_137207:294-1058(-)